jgi:hypothetical protein
VVKRSGNYHNDRKQGEHGFFENMANVRVPADNNQQRQQSFATKELRSHG